MKLIDLLKIYNFKYFCEEKEDCQDIRIKWQSNNYLLYFDIGIKEWVSGDKEEIIDTIFQESFLNKKVESISVKDEMLEVWLESE